jgi:putative oxidoreductase
MIDNIASAPAPVDNTAGVKAMSRLADRLLAAAPASAQKFSPAVTAALSRNAATAARATRRSRSIVSRAVDSFVSACSFIPYALVALVLRLMMARLLFVDGQVRVEGPRVPLHVQDFDLSVVLPLHVKSETVTAFFTQYAALPLPAVVAAYLVSYAEFILPICLMLGLGTRFNAFALLLATAMLQIYVMPQALWSVHVYWASILLVLLSLGAGPISVDHVIRFLARR